MQLFKNRPLCFICMLFAVCSILATRISFRLKLVVLISLAVIAAVLVFLAFVNKKREIAVISVLLCVVSVGGAFANSVFRMDYVQKRADGYVGTQKIVCDVLEREYSSYGSSAYRGDIVQIGEEKASFACELRLSFPTELSTGDRVYAIAELENDEDRTDVDGTVFIAFVDNSEQVLVEYFDREAPFYKRIFYPMGMSVMIDDIKTGIKTRIDKLFGEDNGALVNGFLIGDTTDIPTEVVRNFRRSGVSHLLAVSGMHISIFLGAVEILLRRLYVHKYVRCAMITVLTLVFLAITGFSMSAARSVFMLWIAYVIFAFSEESDPPTTLFVALAIILIVFPNSVFSLGMWMSFLATLGLVTVYPLFEKIIPYKKHNNVFKRVISRLCKGMLFVIGMSVISNLFLLPIQWYFFGELSAVAVPANLLLSSFASFYMVFSVITLLIGGIPVVGALLARLVCLMTEIILWVTERFSHLEISTVSLRYPFADVLVIAFTLAMIVFLVIKLPKKWMIAIPMASFVLVFSVSAAIYDLQENRYVSFYGACEDEVISVSDGKSLCIIDMSGGGYYGLYRAFDGAKAHGATCVDRIIFTDITKRHVSTMDYFLRYSYVKEIYVPIPQGGDEEQISVAIEMTRLAMECNTEVKLYGSGELMTCGETYMVINSDKYDRRTGNSVFIAGNDTVFAYVDSVSVADTERIKESIMLSDIVIVGNNGEVGCAYLLPAADETAVIYTSAEIADKSVRLSERDNVYVSRNEYTQLIFELD